MKALSPILLTVLLVFACLPLMAQAAQGMQEESGDLVSLDPTTRFAEAMSILQFYTVKYEGKIIVDLTSTRDPIGIPINRIHWKAAFLSIMTANQFKVEETVNAYVIYPSGDGMGRGGGDAGAEGVRAATLDDEVLIEVTFFEADQTTLHEIGIDWSTLMNGEVDFTANLDGASNVANEIFNLAVTHTLDTGSGTIDVDLLLKTIEAHDKGHIISRPQITVSSGLEGFVQDGVDFSIKTTDEDGNTTDQFFSAGTIVTVTPVVRTDASGMKYVQLHVEAERSSAEPSSVSTTVTISKASTDKLLYNGEEAVIGGLTSKETAIVRRGLPFFKDLPWWVFGIRYLTGYDYHEEKNKELLIIIRASILPSMYERMDNRGQFQDDVRQIRDSVPRIEQELLTPEQE